MKTHRLERFLAGAALLLGAGLAAPSQTTTFQAEIRNREARLTAIAAELRALEEGISAREGQIRDFLLLHDRIEALAAEAGGRPARGIDPQAFALAGQRPEPGRGQPLDPTGRMAAEASSLLHPSSHPIRSPQEAAAVAQRAGPFQTPSFEFRDGGELLRAYELLRETFSAAETRIPLGEYYRRRCLIDERERLTLQIAALRGGETDAAAAATILGTWRLDTQNNGSVIEVVRNPNTGAFAGVLRVCKLKHFSPNGTVFVVTPVPGGGGASFAGREFGYSNDGLPVISPLSVSVAADTMTYRTAGETLQWRRFVPWGDRRATLGQPPPDAGFEDFQDF